MNPSRRRGVLAVAWFWGGVAVFVAGLAYTPAAMGVLLAVAVVAVVSMVIYDLASSHMERR